MRPGDGERGLRRHMPLDDEAVDRLLEGRKLADPGDLAHLAPVLDDIRSLGSGPAPAPSPALRRILSVGAPEDTWPMHGLARTRHQNAGGRRLGVRAPWATVAAAAALAVAATLDVLPKPAQRMVANAVSAVTPFELPGATQDQSSVETTPGEEAGRASRPAKAPPVRPPSAVREPAPTRPAAPGHPGGVPLPPATSRTSGGGNPPRPTVPAASAPVTSSASRSAPGTSLPTTTVAVSSVPVVTNPPSSQQSAGVVTGPDRRRATLTGALVVPGPGDPDGTGSASIEINAEKGELCSTLTLSAISPPTAVHLHQAPDAQTGPVVLELPPPPEIAPPAAVCVLVPSELLRKLREEPAGYYLEVHTREFSDGALRGQLSI